MTTWITSAHSASPHLRWPADRFFWSVLEAPGMQASYKGVVPEGLLADLADDLPVPLEEVQAVCSSMGPGRLIVAAARRDALAQLLPGTLSLTPIMLPTFARALAPDQHASSDDPGVPARINLLIAELEPIPIRRSRARTHALLAATMAVACGLVALGLARRAESWQVQATRDRDHASHVIQSAMPDPGADLFSLEREVQRLREARSTSPPLTVPIDVTPVLAQALHGWPTELAAEAQSIALTPTGLSYSVLLEAGLEPAEFLGSLRPPLEWTIDETRHTNVSGGDGGGQTRLSVRLRPLASPSSPSMGARP